MFKSITMAVLALSMTLDVTGKAGQDLYQVQQEALQEVQQRKAEEALDDDTTYLEENPEAYMSTDDYADQDSYRGNYEQHLVDAEKVACILSGYRLGTPEIEVNKDTGTYMNGTFKFRGLNFYHFIMYYDDYGPTSVGVDTETGFKVYGVIRKDDDLSVVTAY